MVDTGGDSQGASPVATEMAFMILEEEAARKLRKSKLVRTDASIVSRHAPDIGVQGPRKHCRSEPLTSMMAPSRTLSVLAKRHRSVESAQVLVALHRQAVDNIHAHQQRFHQQIISTNVMTTTAPPQLQPQVMQQQEENAYEANIDDDDQKTCTTPTHSSIQQEGPYVCPPPPPNKPKSKPRKHTTPPHKSFFVPSDLHHLPLCFQSLFS